MLIKKLLFISFLIFTTNLIQAQQPVIIEAAGWFETAYVRWEPVANAESYNVYVSGEGITNRKIDTQLIRSYGSYLRADVPGLKAGSYTLRIVPVTGGNEADGATTQAINVSAHVRSGFAFANGRVPGAYKSDGTPKDNAVIIYITENTKNTISMNVTGANANPCVGLQTILDGFKKGRDNRPLIVRMIGQITDPAVMYNGDIVIENANNANSFITIEGIGDDAVADGWGIRIKNASNIEIRNIGTMNCNSSEGDNIGLQQENEYIWVHHCDFFYGNAGSDADQIKGDGALDSKRSTYVTFAFNHFWDSGKSHLVGLSEGTTSGLFITFHHNWYDHSDSRHPRVRYYSAHVYNNYYDGISKYGIGSTMGSSIFSEGNYFRNCRYPMLISMQGSDVWDESKQANDYTNMPTFSKEDGGIIKAFNNFMTGQRRFVAYGATGFPNPTVDFDAVVVSSRNETIPGSITSSRGANAYNNFDTNPAVMYAYTADSPEQARDRVMQFAGRIGGGDFKWTFNNAVDDNSYAVNTGLKNALTSYKTKLVSIQGDGENQGGGDNGGGDNGGGEPADGAIHNFTLHGKTSTFFTITGNLSDSKGTVNYAGLTLTQCLKLESSTLITFTTTEASVLTLVLNHDFNGRVKVNGTDRTASAGIITIEIPAGSHQITRGDTSNLFYMSVVKKTTSVNNLTVVSQIYPNPVRDILYISKEINANKVEVYSLSGVLMHRSDISDNRIDLSSLQSGSYLIRISTSEGVLNQRIIKQ
jgi:pectate lyase